MGKKQHSSKNQIWTEQELEDQRKKIVLENLSVFYGITKLNNIIKKRSVKIVFENAWCHKNRSKVERLMHIFYERPQTKNEKTAAPGNVRIFSVFEMFIDQKPYLGDIDFILDQNFKADQKEVSVEERQKIKIALEKALKEFYKIEPKNVQLNFNF